MFSITESYLLSIANIKPSPGRNLIANMVTAIQKNSASKLKDIIIDRGYSQKQAIQIFKHHVGLNPKSFQRIVRFNEILLLILDKKSIAWQDVCTDCYYYDQSHFIREFKAFCGYSPSEFITDQASHHEPNFPPLD